MQEELKALIEAEAEKAKENPEYIQKRFEIIDGEIKEVLPNEAENFFADPINAPEYLQKKYLGVTYAEYKEPEDFAWEVFEGFQIIEKNYKNPFTWEEKIIKEIQEIPFYFEEKKRELDEINEEFERMAREFLAEYTPSEIATFETKRNEAEKVLAGWESPYLEKLIEEKNKIRAAYWKPLWTMESMVECIKKNSDAYAIAYTQLEAWKDAKLAEYRAKYNII